MSIWKKLSPRLIVARAYNSGGQTINTGGNILNLDTIDFDPTSIVDLDNDRIKPVVSGYYICCGVCQIQNIGESKTLYVQLRKNGTPCGTGTITTSWSGAWPSSSAVSLVYFNGSTDYLQLFVYHNDSPKQIMATRAQSFLCLLGPME